MKSFPKDFIFEFNIAKYLFNGSAFIISLFISGRKVRESKDWRRRRPFAPFGFTCVAAYIREQSFSVNIIDALAENLTVNEILEYIKDCQPKVIGFSAMTPQFSRAVHFAKEIIRSFSNILTRIGRHHASILYRNTLKENPCFTFWFMERKKTLLSKYLENIKNKLGIKINF